MAYESYEYNSEWSIKDWVSFKNDFYRLARVPSRNMKSICHFISWTIN